MLAFRGSEYLGQLYLQEYDPVFTEPGGWFGHRPWADFRVAEPLGLAGRYLTLGCYHVGWMPDGSRRESLWGRGIGTALLSALVEWYSGQDAVDGLLTWALATGSHPLLQEAGQMPHTVYERFGFREIAQVHDPRWARGMVRYGSGRIRSQLEVLRVMALDRLTPT
jgi:GNAT superfamily N-acetyltransferase